MVLSPNSVNRGRAKALAISRSGSVSGATFFASPCAASGSGAWLDGWFSPGLARAAGSAARTVACCGFCSEISSVFSCAITSEYSANAGSCCVATSVFNALSRATSSRPATASSTGSAVPSPETVEVAWPCSLAADSSLSGFGLPACPPSLERLRLEAHGQVFVTQPIRQHPLAEPATPSHHR